MGSARMPPPLSAALSVRVHRSGSRVAPGSIRRPHGSYRRRSKAPGRARHRLAPRCSAAQAQGAVRQPAERRRPGRGGAACHRGHISRGEWTDLGAGALLHHRERTAGAAAAEGCADRRNDRGADRSAGAARRRRRAADRGRGRLRAYRGRERPVHVEPRRDGEGPRRTPASLLACRRCHGVSCVPDRAADRRRREEAQLRARREQDELLPPPPGPASLRKRVRSARRERHGACSCRGDPARSATPGCHSYASRSPRRRCRRLVSWARPTTARRGGSRQRGPSRARPVASFSSRTLTGGVPRPSVSLPPCFRS